MIKNLNCGDLEIPLAVIRLGVIPPGLVWGKGGGGVVWFSVCEAPMGV